MSVTEDPPVIGNVINGLSDQLDRLLIQLGVPLNPPGGAPRAAPPQPAPNWGVIRNQLAVAWPGYPWPASFNAEIVASYMADVLGRLATETQYQYFVGLLTQSEVDQIFWDTIDNNNYWSLSRQISRLQASQGGAVTLQQVQQLSGSLQNQINQVAANAWGNLWALYNNQVVPLVDSARNDAWNNLWALYNNQVRPLVNGARQEAFSNLWSLYNNQVVPAIAGEATARTNGDVQLGQALTAEQAQREADTNTLQMQVTNETARATQAENLIGTSLIPAAVLSLRTALQPQIDALKTETDSCLKPLCDTVTPNASQLGTLGKLLKALESGGWLALLLAAIADATIDPIGAAQRTDATLGAYTQKLAGDFRAAVSAL